MQNMIYKLKESRLYDKYLEFDMHDFKLTFELPLRFLENPDLIYEKVHSLDEVNHFMKRDYFQNFRYSI